MPMTAGRVLVGIFCCISGGTKLLVPAQFSAMEQTMVQSHIPFPRASALFVSLVEFVCGGGLALGLLTPLCARGWEQPGADTTRPRIKKTLSKGLRVA